MRIAVLAWTLSGTVALAAAPQQGTDPNARGAAPIVSEIVATQVMLDRAGFSSGEIDGEPGPNVQRALRAFQQREGLPPSNSPEAATWDRLAQATGSAPPLVMYTITDQDVAGPFQADIPADLVEQSKLPALAYRNPLEGLGEKFHASPRLLQMLNPGASFMRAGESIFVPNVIATDAPPPASPQQPRPRVTIIVTKETSALTVEDEGGRVLFHAPVTTGSDHDPLPIGRWKVTGIQQMPAFHYNPNLFWDANPSHSKARIPPGPNNPVGVAWIDISKEHYGIHGAPEPSRVGHTQSHGCVRLANWDIRRVLEWARAGTPVVFR